MPVTKATYEQVAREDPGAAWELVCGHLRSKPSMSFAHDDVIHHLAYSLFRQLDEGEFTLRINTGRLRISGGTYYVPDLFVIPLVLQRQKLKEMPARLEVYDEPMPLVVEVWSPSTGDYDVEQKLREYQQRGDAEIWRLHPYDKTLTAWRRRAGGGYGEVTYSGGSVQPVALPGVTIDLDRLFA